MGGIDKVVMLLSVYGTKYRSRKWYHRVAFHLFSLKVCNSWIIYQKLAGDSKSLVDFLAEICILLMHEISSTADSEYDVRSEVEECRYPKRNVLWQIQSLAHSYWYPKFSEV